MPVMPQKRRRLADRAAGVGAGRRRQQPRRDRRRRAARRAARHARRVPRIAAPRRKRSSRCDEPIANSSQLSLPRRDRAGRGEPRDHGRIERAAIAFQHLRAGGARQVARDEDVLVRDRHAEQRRRRRRAAMRASAARGLAPASRLVDRRGSAPSVAMRLATRASEMLRRARRVRRPCARSSCARQLGARASSCRSRSLDHLRHEEQAVARRRGALRWFASRWFGSVTTSSRSRRRTVLHGGERRARAARRRSCRRRCICSTMREEAVELREHALALVGLQFEPRQVARCGARRAEVRDMGMRRRVRATGLRE